MFIYVFVSETYSREAKGESESVHVYWRCEHIHVFICLISATSLSRTMYIRVGDRTNISAICDWLSPSPSLSPSLQLVLPWLLAENGVWGVWDSPAPCIHRTHTPRWIYPRSPVARLMVAVLTLLNLLYVKVCLMSPISLSDRMLWLLLKFCTLLNVNILTVIW